MVIISKVDQIMTEKGITSAQLADVTGLPRMTIGNARRGKGLTLKIALRISRALGTPLEMVWALKEVDEEGEEEDVA